MQISRIMFYAKLYACFMC